VSKASTEIILQDAINCGSGILENMVVENYMPYFCVDDMLSHELWIGNENIADAIRRLVLTRFAGSFGGRNVPRERRVV
jgi:hypothetical protein